MRSSGLNGVTGFASVVLLFGASAPPLRAESGFAVELFEPMPVAGRAILGVSTSDTLRQGELAVGLLAHYEDDPLTLVQKDDRGRVLERFIDDRFTVEALGGVGILDGFEVGLALPLVLSQSGSDLAADGAAPPAGMRRGLPPAWPGTRPPPRQAPQPPPPDRR